MSDGSYRKAGRDKRGNSKARFRRRAWIRKTFGSPSGKTVKCFWCPRRLRSRFEVDRHPVPGHAGGRYVHDNIVPSCRQCNRRCHCAECVGRKVKAPPRRH